MPDYTENLNLAKPVPGTDVADITVLNENMDKIDEWSKDINAKTREATTVIPGIVKFGDDTSTALEGHRMAQIQGVEKFGGDVQIAGTKKVGYAYWCTVNKDMYICKVENSLNYIDASYFEAFSNNALLGKLNNLDILIDEKLKKLCPFPINSIFQTFDDVHPALIFVGTTWEKIEDKFLLSSGNDFSNKTTGGNISIGITEENLPAFRLQVDSFSLGRGTMNITGAFGTCHGDSTWYQGAFYESGSTGNGRDGNGWKTFKNIFDASRSWDGMTTLASPYTNYIGNNEPLNIMPPFIAINTWKRLT